MESPLPRSSVPDAVFERLREAILAGRYAPGECLPTQRALAADLRVNIASVREALGRLEQLRLIDVRHGDATRVLDWRRSGGLEALAVIGSMDAQLAGDLFEARRLLLGEAARLAAGRRTDEQAAELEELAGALTAAPDDGSALLADWAFMSALVAAAGNLVFQLVMNSVRELYLPHAGAFAALVSDRENLAPMYLAVAEAVGVHNAERAVEQMDRLAGAQEARMVKGL
ncbi:MAG: regulatory protein GntR [Solirubrobacterales bacterium]|nr:regulatory protein GntR [Solirubrobacterales bacterium]